MNRKPLSVSIAQDYNSDAYDYVERFDILLEHPLTKTGRIKRFIDLLMGCECILKAHTFLGLIESDLQETYRQVRKAGHKIDRLADLACFSHDRTSYDFLKSELQPFSVVLRYSLDANEAFFPVLEEWSEADINYSETIANQRWLLLIRHHLNLLINELVEPLGVWCEDDFSAVVVHAKQMRAFVRAVKK